MNVQLSDKIIHKYNQQIDQLLKHEELQKQRKFNEYKLHNIFDHHFQIQEQIHQLIRSSHQDDQLKISQEKVKQLQYLEKQKKDKKAAQYQLLQIEQKQHEYEIKQRIFEIQKKLKYEEFKKKTDDLMNYLDQNLRSVNIHNFQKQEYMNDQEQQTLNSSMQMNISHYKNVYSNYQMQMKRIQEICQQKLMNYEIKINKIYKQKYEKMDYIQQNVQSSQQHLDIIKERSNQIFQNKINKIKEKINYFQDKINLIEKKRLINLQFTYNNQYENYQQIDQIRAKSQNIFRNKSLILLNKQIMKEQTFQLVQHQNQLELEQKLSRLNQKWITQQQSQAIKTDQFKYIQQLESKINQRDQKLQDQIQNKLEIQKRRLKIIEDMDKQKRDMLLKLESDKIYTSELKYFHNTPKQQSKLFIT